MFNKDLFADRLTDLRHASGLSQEQLGTIIAVSKQAINEIEKGRSTTTLDRAVRLADYFNVSLDYLVGRSNDPNRY